jgi:hypothetical protein
MMRVAKKVLKDAVVDGESEHEEKGEQGEVSPVPSDRLLRLPVLPVDLRRG